MSDTTVAEDPAPTARTTFDKKVRSPRTNLEADIKSVCDQYVLGHLSVPEGKQLTPHVIAAAVMRDRGEDAKVSSGAVAACLNRWAEIGFIELNDKPLAFKDYTEAGRIDGLGELKRQHTARKAAARAAEREASKPVAAPAPAPASSDAPF